MPLRLLYFPYFWFILFIIYAFFLFIGFNFCQYFLLVCHHYLFQSKSIVFPSENKDTSAGRKWTFYFRKVLKKKKNTFNVKNLTAESKLEKYPHESQDFEGFLYLLLLRIACLKKEKEWRKEREKKWREKGKSLFQKKEISPFISFFSIPPFWNQKKTDPTLLKKNENFFFLNRFRSRLAPS